MTTVVNIYKAPYDIYIGRAGRGKDGYFGNPFPITPDCDRDRSIGKFETYFNGRLEHDPEFKRRVLELKDKSLGCFCKPAACHGDVIAAYLNKQYANVQEPLAET